MAFTARDTPGVVARIGGDLDLVTRAVRAADPGLLALVLTGGFARGEGAVLHGAPVNDYDLVALRRLAAPPARYGALRRGLEARLGLHLDLAPVAAARLPWVARSIFWYETALRGRVLWGPDLLGRIPVRSPGALDRAEGLRLLANRAAGLLLATRSPHALDHRVAAAKALLAALDVHLLSRGCFAPSQTERWRQWTGWASRGATPAAARAWAPWFRWAFHVKVDPGTAPWRGLDAAWRAGAGALLDAVPAALARAGLPGLEAYGRRDSVLDHLYYYGKAARIPGAWRLARHPASRVRVATLRALGAALDGTGPPEAVRRTLGPVARGAAEPLGLLEALRGATRQ